MKPSAWPSQKTSGKPHPQVVQAHQAERAMQQLLGGLLGADIGGLDDRANGRVQLLQVGDALDERLFVGIDRLAIQLDAVDLRRAVHSGRVAGYLGGVDAEIGKHLGAHRVVVERVLDPGVVLAKLAHTLLGQGRLLGRAGHPKVGLQTLLGGRARGHVECDLVAHHDARPCGCRVARGDGVQLVDPAQDPVRALARSAPRPDCWRTGSDARAPGCRLACPCA